MDFALDQVEIVVVDSGNRAAGGEDLARSQNARYSRSPDHGVAAARNHGASLAAGELLLFVDDDIVVAPSNLRQHETIHMSHDPCLVGGHWEFDPDLRLKLEASPLGRFRLAYEDLYNTPDAGAGEARSGVVHSRTLAAANLSIKREVFWSLGGFDQRFPVGAEDQDLSWRAAKAGCKLLYDFDICVIHNDQHTDLVALCSRLERGAMGTVYFSRKNPDAPAAAMLSMNGPVRRDDSARAVVRKLSRDLLSRRAPLALVHRLIKLVERARPNGDWPLEFLYRAVGGLHVFRGVRRGLELTSGNEWAAAHDGR